MWEGVVPTVLVEWAVLGIANTVLPLIACFEVGAFNDTSSRETEDARIKIFEVFYEVGTKSMPVVGREKTDVVEVNTFVRHKEDAHKTFLNSLV